MKNLTPPTRHSRPCLALEPYQLLQHLRVRARHAPGRELEPYGQVGVLLHGGEEGGYGTVAEVHHMRPGQPGGRHRGEQLHQTGPPLGDGGPGQEGSEKVHRGMLDEVPGGPAVRIADDFGALGEGTRPGDAGALQGGRGGESGVPGVEPEEGGRATESVLDVSVADRQPPEHVVIQSPSDHPPFCARGGGEGGAELVEIADGGEVGAGGHLQTPDGMAVGVGESRGEGGSAEIEPLGTGSAQFTQVVGVPDTDDRPAPDGDGGGGGPVRIEGADAGSGDEEVG